MAHVVHFEFSVPNPERAAEFFQAVFGWSARRLPDPVRYWQVQTADSSTQASIPGGVVESKSAAARTSITVQVESLDVACAKVIGNGGAIVPGRQVVPGYGVHVLCKDPQGIFFAMIEPLSGS